MSMAINNDVGKKGEALGADYFRNLGYELLQLNWRYRHFEVDIIASKNGMLHFIEVKCRSSAKYGFPEESISKKKIRNLIDASEEYLYRHPEWKRIQFDVLSINFVKNNEPEYFLIEDVYL